MPPPTMTIGIRTVVVAAPIGGAAAERVADRHVVVDEAAGERTIALDRQADERRGGRDAELAACRRQRLISRHSDSSVRTST